MVQTCKLRHIAAIIYPRLFVSLSVCTMRYFASCKKLDCQNYFVPLIITSNFAFHFLVKSAGSFVFEIMVEDTQNELDLMMCINIFVEVLILWSIVKCHMSFSHTLLYHLVKTVCNLRLVSLV